LSKDRGAAEVAEVLKPAFSKAGFLFGGIQMGGYLSLSISGKYARRLSMKRTIFIFCALLVPLYFSSVANAEVLTSISGRVIAEDTGEGLAGFNVMANPEQYHTVTDEDGKFVLEDIGPGTYTLSFYKEDTSYVSELDSLEVVVPTGRNVVNVNRTLRLGGGITGTVFDADGTTPLSDITVYAYVLGQPKWVDSETMTGTDDNGVYHLRGLPETERCIVGASREGYPAIEKETSIVKGEVISGVDFVFTDDDITGISGFVRLSTTNEPIKKAMVVVDDIEGGTVASMTTDDNGYYIIKGLSPGNYEVTVHTLYSKYISKSNIIGLLSFFNKYNK
jgi:uncharacterized surface anchored protein